MAKIYNSDCTKGLAQNAGIQQSAEKVPNELAEKIVPTFETNPKLLRNSSGLYGGSSQASGTMNISNVAIAGKRTFLTYVQACYVKDAANDRATGIISVGCTPKGKGPTDMIIFPIITLTAQEGNQIAVLNPPLELEPNTNITFTGTYAAGVMSRGLSVYGFQLDNPNA